jgi:DNA polymerase
MVQQEQNWITLFRHYLKYQIDAGLGEVLLPASRPAQGVRSSLEAVRQELGDCTRCPLHKSRTNIVFGEGSPRARIMFVGEGPGADEDREGRPFVGRAGQLLTRMIRAMGMDRSEVYIANVVKCRPPGNRNPNDEEIFCCLQFLEAQIGAVNPEVIVTLGRIAANSLLKTTDRLGTIRGHFHTWRGIPVMPTYHPSFLLRQEPDRLPKAQAWADLKMVLAQLGLSVPGSGDKP